MHGIIPRPDSAHRKVGILIRYNDFTTGTITEHDKIVSQKGYVWWGKWGEKKIGVETGEEIKRRIQQYGSVRVYFTTGIQGTTDTAELTQFVYSRGTKIPSPEVDAVPPYYRGDDFYAWLRLKNFQRVRNIDWHKIFLHSHPSQEVVDTFAGMTNFLLIEYLSPPSGSKPTPTSSQRMTQRLPR